MPRPDDKPHSQNVSREDLARKNKKVAAMVLIIVACMVGLSFAAVPLYDLFCRVTGFGGTPQISSEDLPKNIVDRDVTIQFNADTDPNMPWHFRPEERRVTVKLGQRGLTAYEAYNPTSAPVSGTALYNVTPLKVGQYFHKIQCFCFDEQILQAGERVSMPVLFYVDPAMNDDPSMDDVKTITLSYTFYRGESKELDAALERFYNQ